MNDNKDKETRKPKGRPVCPNCYRYADRERDRKGKLYIACYLCNYDSRYSALPLP